MRLHMMCPDAMCRRAPVSISKGIAIKPRVMIRQHTEIDLVRLKPAPPTEGPTLAGPLRRSVNGSALASGNNTAARTYGG
jgi:hypothetical protein